MRVYVIGSIHLDNAHKNFLTNIGYNEIIEEDKNSTMKKRISDMTNCDAVYSVLGTAISTEMLYEKRVSEICNIKNIGDGYIFEPKDILHALCNYLKLSFAEVTSSKRNRILTNARIIFALYCNQKNIPIKVTSSVLHKDRTTVIYYIKQGNNIIQFDEELKELYDNFNKLLN